MVLRARMCGFKGSNLGLLQFSYIYLTLLCMMCTIETLMYSVKGSVLECYRLYFGSLLQYVLQVRGTLIISRVNVTMICMMCLHKTVMYGVKGSILEAFSSFPRHI